MSGSRELALSLLAPHTGEAFMLTIQYSWLDHARESLTGHERAIKEGIWQWYRSLDRASRERVSSFLKSRAPVFLAGLISFCAAY